MAAINTRPEFEQMLMKFIQMVAKDQLKPQDVKVGVRNVAAAVSSGFVDAGIGIMAAALASDLEFIPLENERYQIAIPSKFIGCHNNVDILLESLMSENLRKQVDALGGYDVSLMGNIAAIVG